MDEFFVGASSPSLRTIIVRWALVQCKQPCSVENLSKAQNENYICIKKVK